MSVRGTREITGVREGRRSSTATPRAVTPSPARSARMINSVSNRSSPDAQACARGTTVERRSAFMPWVSETRRPNPTRSSVEKVAVTARRVQGRRSSDVGGTLRRDDHGERGVIIEGHKRSVEELEREVVDVEGHDEAPFRLEEPMTQRRAVVGVGECGSFDLGIPLERATGRGRAYRRSTRSR